MDGTSKLFNFIHFDEIDSTNNYIKKNYAILPDFTVVTADCQTAGRGRMGKSFVSPKGTGAYFSLLIKENISREISKHLTVIAAVAVAEELKTVTQRDVMIKWVNDVYIDGKKVCGILTEGSVNPKKDVFDYAVIGIGINLEIPQNGFPESICNTATSLYERGCRLKSKNDLINSIVNRIYLMIIGDDINYVDRYRHLSLLNGKKINIINGISTESATALYIDENCNLVVKSDENDKIMTLFTGDVSIKLR